MITILNDYLNTIKDMTATDKEYTHRAALQKLLNDLADKITDGRAKIKHEPNYDKEGRGAPDFAISLDSLNTLPIGYIEN